MTIKDESINKKQTNESMTEIFADIGKKMNFNNVTAEFVAFKDLKVKWTRSNKLVNFQISDYFEYASDEMIRDLATRYFSKITGNIDMPFDSTLLEYMTSEEFIKRCQPIYIKRSRNLTKDHKGTNKDIDDAVNRLIGSGIIDKKYIENVYFSWTKEEMSSKIAYLATLMRTIVISKELDDPDVPNYVFDYMVLHEILTLNDTYNMYKVSKDPIDFMSKENEYPKLKEAEKWFYDKGLYL